MANRTLANHGERPINQSKPRTAPDLTTGRANQKARTYQALIEAAINFVRAGQDFSVADVADAARVGRTTAYTYFPTKESLFARAVWEFVVRADYADLSELMQESTDVTARVDAVIAASDASVARHEEQYRALLRVSLQSEHLDGLSRRPAYRQQRLADAVAPIRDELEPWAFERLVAALTLCVGVEAQISLCDICGLTSEDAREVKLWAASALLRAALADAKQSESAPEPRKSRPWRTSDSASNARPEGQDAD